MNTTIARWNPLRELGEFQTRILNAFRPDTERPTNGGQMTAAEWTPPVNVWEDEEAYYIEADLPGLEQKNVKVTLENRLLTVSGQRAFHVTGEKYRHHIAERSFGRFTRTFTLPSDVDAENIAAQFKNGVLLLHIGKSKAARPREITIKTTD
jgi:HSP20 family protein